MYENMEDTEEASRPFLLDSSVVQYPFRIALEYVNFFTVGVN